AAAFAGIDALVVRFVNGRLRADLSDAMAQAGLAIAPLGDVLRHDISIAREVFGRLEAAGQEKVRRPLAILNTAAATEGLAMQAHGPVALPVLIAHDQIGEGASLIRHVVRVEAGASLTVLEAGVPTNSVMEVDVADGGRFHHIRVQIGERAPAATHLFARIGAGAEFKTFTLTADGSLTRNEVVLDLAGDHASGHIAGAVLGQGKAHLDNTVFVTHSAEHGESRQVFKNVLAGASRGIFQGKIFVRQAAQKTDGYQISQSVLLDEGAQFLAKPELEIYADDVKCSHGSTTGALDAAALFYLRSRGVPRRAAEAMLVEAFVDEAVAEIADAGLQARMRALVADWMADRA
ncbi:MAG: SufD family Fe-S cluster assembly protein, partial [Thermohalobaculum sp.]|nr:SufD family Fe-S cluster assembly protein [Thermohalobaculum sp.]